MNLTHNVQSEGFLAKLFLIAALAVFERSAISAATTTIDTNVNATANTSAIH